MIPFLGHTALFFALGAAVWLSGTVLRLLLPDLGRWRHLASFCLGLTYWTAGLFALAATGFLTRGGLGVAALPLLALAVFRRRREHPEPARRPPERPRPSAAELAFGVFLAVVLLLHLALALDPRVSWDADVYHLTLPRLYVEEGGFRPVEMSVYSNWPLATELHFAAAMLIGDYRLAKTVHFGFGLLVLYALFVGSRDRTTAGLAVTLFLANEVVAAELSAAYVDLALAFFLLSSLIFMHRALEDDGDRARAFLLLSGLAGGLAAGVKVSGIVGAVIIGAVGLVSAGRQRRLGPWVTHFVAPVALLWMPWLVKAAWYTGNPLYPFFHEWLGGPDWSAALGVRFSDWQAAIGMGRAPLDYLLLPLRVILLGGPGYHRFYGEISPFWIAIVPLALVLGRRDPLARRALAASGLYFAFWALSSQQMRFLIPLLALLAIPGAVALTRLLERQPSVLWRRGAVLAAAAAVVLTVHAGPLAVGAPEEARLEAHHFINESLPADARLLFLNTNRGFFCHREFLADSFFEASQIAAWLGDAATVAEVRDRLRRRGVTHLLFDQRPNVAWPSSLMRLLDDESWVDVLFTTSDTRYLVLELR